MDRADEIAHEIERKLCSFCCNRLDDQPKPEPCDDCHSPGFFEEAERTAVAAILRAEIARLTAERDMAMAALKPFAEYADPTAVFPPTIPISNGSALARRQLTMGDCYEAARALGQPPQTKKARPDHEGRGEG